MFSLIQGSDASDRKPKTIVTIFFLIKIQVTRGALFYETLNNPDSFIPGPPPPPPHPAMPRMWLSSSWFRIVADESQIPDGGRDDEGGTRGICQQSLQEVSYKLPNNTSAYIPLIRI